MAENFTIKQLDEFRQAFMQFDTTGDGFISGGNVRSVLAKMGLNCTKEQVTEFMAEHDKQHSGKVNFPTFLHMLVERLKENTEDEETRHAFKVFDSDGSGMIDSQELQRAMAEFGERLTPDQINDMIREADFDGDGQINYQEFVQMLKPSIVMK